MFQSYFKSIQKTYLTSDEHTELTFRTPLENFLNSFLKEKNIAKLKVIHEAKKQVLKGKKGKPDFKVINSTGIPIGYIETKGIGENLDNELQSEQFKRYCVLSENIILTDYLRFILVRKGSKIQDTTLFSLEQLKKHFYKLDEPIVNSLEQLLNTFFDSQPIPITNPKELAVRLSGRAKYLQQFCLEELENTDDEVTKIDGLYDTFKSSLLPDLEHKDFANIYAQTITYGLFLAFLNCEKQEQLNAQTAYDFLPEAFPLIKELFHEIENFPDSLLWVIDEILGILKCVDREAILKAFSFSKGQRGIFVDPYIYFYEDFLAHYDRKQRKIRGVYYTPESVVSFIVRSVEKILKDKLDIHDVFLNHQVTVLDFACGTGTFLVDVFKSALDEANKIGDKETIRKEVNEHMLQRFIGFELLVAPYVVSHLKLSQFLKERGYPLEHKRRLNVLLTNTLDHKKPIVLSLLPTLTREGQEANKIKNQEILVVMGNPPYSVSSTNTSDWILSLIDDYKPQDERKLNLDDDYIKFIRFANWKMEQVQQGIVAIITNNSYLNGITHRKMRGKLLTDFSEIYILNLHGNSRIGECCPDGSKDENVFDIKQGVSIALFVKEKIKNKKCHVYSYDLYGLREAKYQFLYDTDISIIKDELPVHELNSKFKETKWGKERFKDDLNFFIPKSSANILEYGDFWGITEIFNHYNSGIQTKRDSLTICFDKSDLKATLNDFKKLSDEDIRLKYRLPPDGRDWTISDAKKNLVSTNFDEGNFQEIHYRPFDIRWTYFTNKSKGFIAYPRYETMKNFASGDNIGLSFSRQVVGNGWQHIFITSQITEGCLVSIKTREWTYTTPLYLSTSEVNQLQMTDILGENKIPNFTNAFVKFINKKYSVHPTPEQILGYIYTICHCPSYRIKYLDLLRIDFPRIVFTENAKLFSELALIGKELIEHHLMKRSYAENICKMLGSGNNFVVEKVEHQNDKVYINNDKYFYPVPNEIWNFYIGGYQVLDKWLKERKLAQKEVDVTQFIQIVNIIDYTIKAMSKIDKLISTVL